jgi:hypothetical protein
MAIPWELELEPTESGTPDAEGGEVEVGKMPDIGGRALAREEDVGIVNRDIMALVEGVVGLDKDAPGPEPELEDDTTCDGLFCLSEPTTPSAVRNSFARDDAVGALYRAVDACPIVPRVCTALAAARVEDEACPAVPSFRESREVEDEPCT